MARKVSPRTFAVVACVPSDLGGLVELARHLRKQNFKVLIAPLAPWPAAKLRKLKSAFKSSELLLPPKERVWPDGASLDAHLRQNPPSEWFGLLRGNEWLSLPFGDVRQCCAALESMKLKYLRATRVGFVGAESRQRIVLLHSAHLPKGELLDCLEDERMMLARGPIQAVLAADPKAEIARLIGAPDKTEMNLYRKITKGLHSSRRATKSARPKVRLPSEDPLANLNEPPGRIALVSFEFMGATSSGGIGTAMSALAELLVRFGHHVELLFCPYLATRNMPDSFARAWQARGVNVTWMPRRVEGERYPAHDYFSYRLTKKLQAMGEFDVIHFHDSAGYGAMPLLMRAAGLAFQHTKILVTLHGPSQWHKRGNHLAWNLDEAYHNHFEEIQHRLADVVISPSRYMLDWLREQHVLADECHVIPNALPIESRAFGIRPSEHVHAKRLIYFGRAEHRKGIDLFMAALAMLSQRGIKDISVIILGALGDGVTENQLRAMAQDLSISIHVESGLGHREALAMLRAEPSLAVLPSRLDNSPYTVYECLENGIPFIATDVGGISELIHPQDRAHVLVKPEDAKALADAIFKSLVHGIKPARLAFSSADMDTQLLSLHGGLVHQARQLREQAAHSPSIADVTAMVHAVGLDAPGELIGDLRAQGLSAIHVFTSRKDKDFVASLGKKVKVHQTLSGLAAVTELEAAARVAKTPYLLFVPVGLRLLPNAVDAMIRLLAKTGADAVCASSYISQTGKIIFAMAGPRELAAIRNGYGSGVFLIRREAFLLPPGAINFNGSSADMHRHVLNHMAARGKLVLGLPEPLVVGGMGQLRKGLVEPDTALASRLAAPWIEALPQGFAGLARMAATHQAAAGFTELQAWLSDMEQPASDDELDERSSSQDSDNILQEPDTIDDWRLGLEQAFRTDATITNTLANTRPSLSVVICTHKRPEGLARLLESLRPQIMGHADRELIVWNDGTHNDAYEAVAKANADLMSYHAELENVGVARARNLAARQASKDYIIFIDDDCVAPRWWLDWLLARLMSMPNIDVIAGTTSALEEDRMLWAERVQAIFSMLPKPIETDQGILFVTANVALRREAFWQAGGFTDCESFSGAGEDTELSLRLHSLGYRMVVDPSWHVYHEVGESLRNRVRRYWKYGLANEWMHARPASRRHVEAVLREACRLSLPQRLMTEFKLALPIARLEYSNPAMAWLTAANKAVSTASYFMGCRAAQRRISRKLALKPAE